MTTKQTVSQEIRERLQAGETLTSTQVAEEYKVSNSLLGVVTAKLRQQGAPLKSERIVVGGKSMVSYRMGSWENGNRAKSEEDGDHVDPPLTIRQIIRQRLLDGQRASTTMLREEFPHEPKAVHVLGDVVHHLRLKGYTVEGVKGLRPRERVYRITKTPTGKKARATKVAVERVIPATPSTTTALRQISNGHGAVGYLPNLLDTLAVTLLAIDTETGIIRIGLQTGEQDLLCEVVGTSPK